MGSHNPVRKASYSNDENLLIMHANTAVASSYAAAVVPSQTIHVNEVLLSNHVACSKGGMVTRRRGLFWGYAARIVGG